MLTKRRAFDSKASYVKKPSYTKWVDFSPISQVTLGSLLVRCSDWEKIFSGLNLPKKKELKCARDLFPESSSILSHNIVFSSSPFIVMFRCLFRDDQIEYGHLYKPNPLFKNTAFYFKILIKNVGYLANIARLHCYLHMCSHNVLPKITPPLFLKCVNI